MATEYIKTDSIIDDSTGVLKEAIRKNPDTLVFTDSIYGKNVRAIYTYNEGVLIQGMPYIPDSDSDQTLVVENNTVGWKDKEYIVSMTWPNNPVCNSGVTILGDRRVILDKIHPVLVTTNDNYLAEVVYELDPTDVSKTLDERAIPVTVEYDARNPNSPLWRTFTIIIDKDTLSDVQAHIPRKVSGAFNLVKDDGTEINIVEGTFNVEGKFADYSYGSDGEYNGVCYTFRIFDENRDLPDDQGTIQGFFLTRDAVIDGTIGEVCVLFPELYYRSRQDNVYNTVEFCLNPSNPTEWTKSTLYGMFPWMCISRDSVLNHTELSPCLEALGKELRYGMFSVPIDTHNKDNLIGQVNLFGVHEMDSSYSMTSPYYNDNISRSISYNDYKVFWWLVSLAWGDPTIWGSYQPMEFKNINNDIDEVNGESMLLLPKQGVWTDPYDINSNLDLVGIKVVPVRAVYPVDEILPSGYEWSTGSQMMVFKNIQAPFTGVPFFLYDLRFEQTQIMRLSDNRGRGINAKWFAYKRPEQISAQGETYIPFYTDASPLQVSPPNSLSVLQYELGSQADILPRTYLPLDINTQYQHRYYWMNNINDLWKSLLQDYDGSTMPPTGWVVVNSNWGEAVPSLSLWYKQDTGGNPMNHEFGLIRCLSRKLIY